MPAEDSTDDSTEKSTENNTEDSMRKTAESLDQGAGSAPSSAYLDELDSKEFGRSDDSVEDEDGEDGEDDDSSHDEAPTNDSHSTDR